MSKTRYVMIDEDTKIEVLQRNCVEINLDDSDPESNNEIIAYLSTREEKDDYNTYPNPDCHINRANEDGSNVEAFFTIYEEKVMREIYKDAPTPIMNALIAALKLAKQDSSEDYGYALIGFLN